MFSSQKESDRHFKKLRKRMRLNVRGLVDDFLLLAHLASISGKLKTHVSQLHKRMLGRLSDTLLYELWGGASSHTEEDELFNHAVQEELIKRGVLERNAAGRMELS